ncbi:MAG: YceI family protein [Bryobacteraceae bacterium]
MKDNELKGDKFFDVKQDPLITFHLTKVVQTGPETFDVPGTFTIRGVSKPEALTLTLSGKGTGNGEVKGTMAFDRKDYGMNSGIPFIKIADRVEVNVPEGQARQRSSCGFSAIASPCFARSEPFPERIA